MKGQWFLISAVIVTGVFLTISFLLKSYYYTDTSKIAVTDEDYYFRNIVYELNKTILSSYNLDEFISFAEKSMAEKGYLLKIENLGGKRFRINLTSERMSIYRVVEY